MSRFARFTDPEGGEVWIVKQWVTKVAKPVRGQYPANAPTLLSIGAQVQAVTQTIKESLKLLED